MSWFQILRLWLQAIEGALAEASEQDKQGWAAELASKRVFPLTVNNARVELTSSMVDFKAEQKKETGRRVLSEPN